MASYALESNLQAAQRTSTPLIHIETPDPIATTQEITRVIQCLTTNGNQNEERPVFTWDAATGFLPYNSASRPAWQNMVGQNQRSPFELGGDIVAQDPVDMLRLILPSLPNGGAVIASHMHRFWGNAVVMQGIQSLREPFKGSERTLYLLSPAGQPVPIELQYDVMALYEPRPNEEAAAEIIRTCLSDAELPQMETLQDAVNAVRGLSAYAIEQEVGIALSRDGLNINALLERQRVVIGETPGLSIYRGTETFKNIGGVDQLKKLLSMILGGRIPVNCIVFIDEIEKSAAGFTSDSSGVSQDAHSVLLKYMADNNQTGVILIGPPGTGKSFMAKAAGNEAGIPTISFDLGAMKDPRGLVGGSEHRIRTAMDTIHGVGGGQALFIATSNGIKSLSPELRSRFKIGIVFQDLPTHEEKNSIWDIQAQLFPKVDMDEAERPEGNNWTGREINACAELAWRMDISLIAAAEFIVPVAVSAREQIDTLRSEAHNRYLSASHPGPYQYPGEGAQASTGRKYNLG